ncbi:MAG: DNA methyltransferase [Planctomycetota bacterium]
MRNKDRRGFLDGIPGTRKDSVSISGFHVNRYIKEFWTSRQRQASSIHEVSYRACFKPQLPRFFIERLTDAGDIVYDPFSGRGTTCIEAGLMGRRVIANDVNPLSEILAAPRFFIPDLKDVEERLSQMRIDCRRRADIDLSMFYHPETEAEIVCLRDYLTERKESGSEDHVDRWIRMVATNRLTGHSKGFFSVYTLPPNQAVSRERQRKINEKRNQKPDYRDTRKLILKKSKALIKDLTEDEIATLRTAGETALFLSTDARHTKEIKSDSVQLTVTSPPFLNVVQYSYDNWLRCWFNGIDDKRIARRITTTNRLDVWTAVMGDVFKELFRITKKGGWVAFEVGEVKSGMVELDEYVVPLGLAAGLECEGIVVNLQQFTKTSKIWGIDNNEIGTNTNRIVLFRK